MYGIWLLPIPLQMEGLKEENEQLMAELVLKKMALAELSESYARVKRDLHRCALILPACPALPQGPRLPWVPLTCCLSSTYSLHLHVHASLRQSHRIWMEVIISGQSTCPSEVLFLCSSSSASGVTEGDYHPHPSQQDAHPPRCMIATAPTPPPKEINASIWQSAFSMSVILIKWMMGVSKPA